MPVLWCSHGVRSAQAASPVNQPPLDLGQTSFLDGEGGPGALLEVIGSGSVSGYATDASGRVVSGTNKQWSANVTLHPVYQTEIPAFGGKLGIEFLFPFSAIHVDAPGHSVTTQGGTGDVTVSPFIQWSDGNLFAKPFSSRFGLQGVVPSGSYASQRFINTGQDAWQVSPYYALTWRPLDAWEVSVRLIYDWSSHSTHPPPSLAATSVQAGSQFAMNYAASYAVSPHLRLGLSGYILRQLDDTRVGGRAVAGSRQQTFGIGPGLLWTGGHAKVIANVFREFASENRAEGTNLIARLLYPF